MNPYDHGQWTDSEYGMFVEGIDLCGKDAVKYMAFECVFFIGTIMGCE